MAPTVLPSDAQLVTLNLLLVAFPRQRSFERQAAIHPTIKDLPSKIILDFYTQQQRPKKGASTRAGPPRFFKLASSASRPAGASHLTSISTQVGRVHPYRKPDEVVTNGLPTPITPTNSADFSFSAFPLVPKSEPATPVLYTQPKLSPSTPNRTTMANPDWTQSSFPSHQSHFDSVALYPTSLTIGSAVWRLFDLSMELLGAELESNGGGALTIDVTSSSMTCRLRIPIPFLAAITLDSSNAILALSRPPHFYIRPRYQPETAWSFCEDPSPNGAATNTVHFILGLSLGLSEHTPAFVGHPLLRNTPIIILPKLRTGDPKKLAFPTNKKLYKVPLFFDERSAPTSTTGAQSTSTAVPPFPVAPQAPPKRVFFPSFLSFPSPPSLTPSSSLDVKPLLAQSKPFASAVKEEAVSSLNLDKEFDEWFNGTSERLDEFQLDVGGGAGGEGWEEEQQLGAEQQGWWGY